MIRLLLLSLFSVLVFFPMGLNAQCPITGQINNFASPAPTQTDCTAFIETDQNVFSGETYTLDDVITGQTYVVDLCGANVWNASLTVYDETGQLVGFDDGIDSGCGTGARISFQANSSGTFSIVCAKSDCSLDLAGNGKMKIFNNTDGVSPCPDAAVIECDVNPSFLSGLQSTGLELSNLPIATCGDDWNMGENPFPERIFIAMGAYDDFSNQPYSISTNVGNLYATNDLENPAPNLNLNVGIAFLLGLSQADLDLNQDVVITFTSTTNETCTESLTIAPAFLPANAGQFCPAEETSECMANAGDVVAPVNLVYSLEDDLIEAPTVSGQNNDDQYGYSFVLTTDLNEGDEIAFDIIALNNDGTFSIQDLGLSIGVYNVHGFSYLLEDGIPNVTNGEQILEAINISDYCADLTGAVYSITIENQVTITCLAEAGIITAPSNLTYFENETSEAPSVIDQNTEDEFGYYFVLTTDSDSTDEIIYNIVALSVDGIFDFEELGLSAGSYNVHGFSYNFNPSLPADLASGEQVMQMILAESICADLTDVVYVLNVEELGSGIEERPALSAIKIHPVPSVDIIHVEFDSQENDYALWHIYDLSGRYVFGGEMNVMQGLNQIKVDIYDFAEGVYFLEIESNGINSTKRFIKE